MPFDIAAVLDTGPGWNKVRLTSGEIVTLKGDYNWRSNNPGNLEFGPFTKSRGAIGSGAIPVGRDRGFAVFPDAETGNNARVALQFESPRYRDLTIEQAISKYAPEFENDSAAYAAHVAAAAGVPVTTKMSDLTQGQRERYAAAQNDFEGMKPGDIYDEQGIRLPPADLSPRPPSLLPNAPLVAGSYPGPNTRRLPPLGPSAGPPAQLVARDIPATRNLLPPIRPSTLGLAPPRATAAPSGRSAGDSLALAPVQGGHQALPAMDASYDGEQGVMGLAPSPVGEMPTLAGTRAAFKLPPLQSRDEPTRRPRVTVSTPYTTPQSTIDRGAERAPPVIRTAALAGSVPLPPNIRPSIPSTAAAVVSASDRARVARTAPPAQAASALPTIPSNLETAQNEQRLLRQRGAPPPVTTIPGTGTFAPPGLASVESVRPAFAQPLPAVPLPQVSEPVAAAPIAPTPAACLQRPGIFGRPQIAGHDIPLPGIFGVLQNATMAMNNASGPFNNGADNAIYNGLRGGDFNARGAATSHAGGYMYAPKQGGGFINVGRVNPAQSGAALYDSRTTRNDSRDDAANRVNGSSSRGSGGARSLLD